MISIETARRLLDFQGGGDGVPSRISRAQADDQLEGAVAIHNILARHRVAYLADEVGMGKTYVALGAFALFRHFDPTFRMLVIAPKQNIQEKWTRELSNFVRNNVRFADRRVKAIHGAPARPAVLCDNLLGLVRETTLDPDRDFFARLTSFSFGLADDAAAWRKKRDDLLRALPWLDGDAFDLRNKDAFKENFARAVCCALPVFDLVIIDEAHNLKGGLTSKAWRNRLLSLAMGREPDGATTPRAFKRFGPRARRVLLLSATPLEDDYRKGGNETFFAWFFRGEGPPGVLSGADLAFRLNTPRYALSSFFLDNWAAAVLGVAPGDVFRALQAHLEMDEDSLREELERRAGAVVQVRRRNRHEELFMAFQYAALSLLAGRRDEIGVRADVVLQQILTLKEVAERPVSAGNWLETPTFFTELRKRLGLRQELWPEERGDQFVPAFRRSELRRQLIASMFRLGHSLIDLWVVYVNQLGRLDAQAAERGEHDAAALPRRFWTDSSSSVESLA